MAEVRRLPRRAPQARFRRVDLHTYAEASIRTSVSGSRAALGHGLPSRIRWYDDRCTSDSRPLAATPKSAESGQIETLRPRARARDVSAPTTDRSVLSFLQRDLSSSMLRRVRPIVESDDVAMAQFTSAFGRPLLRPVAGTAQAGAGEPAEGASSGNCTAVPSRDRRGNPDFGDLDRFFPDPASSTDRGPRSL